MDYFPKVITGNTENIFSTETSFYMLIMFSGWLTTAYLITNVAGIELTETK